MRTIYLMKPHRVDKKTKTLKVKTVPNQVQTLQIKYLKIMEKSSSSHIAGKFEQTRFRIYNIV